MSTKTKALLKAEIDSKVTENGSNQITGEKLNDVLNDMVDSLCDGTNFDEGSIPDAALENPVSVSQNTITIGGQYVGELNNPTDSALLNSQIAELYLDTDKTGLKIRKQSGWLQIYDGETLYAQFAIIANSIQKSVYGSNGYVVYTPSVTTDDTPLSLLIGAYNVIEKNPIIYKVVYGNLKLTDSEYLNNLIKEIFIDTTESNLKITIYNNQYLQVFDNIRTNLIAQFTITTSSLVRSAVGSKRSAVVFNDCGTISYNEGYKQLNNLAKRIEYSPTIALLEVNGRYVLGNDSFANEIAELYLDTELSNLMIGKMSGWLQIWNGDTLYSQFAIVPGAAQFSVYGAKGVVVYTSSANTNDSNKCPLIGAYKEITRQPIAYSKYKYVKGDGNFDSEIAELYLETNKTDLTICKQATWLQIWDGETLYAQFAISPNSIKQQVYGPNGYVVYTGSANTNNAPSCQLIGPYNILERNPIIYQVAKNEVTRIYQVKKIGGGDYTSLLECVLEATKYMDSKIYVDAGEYDLISEFEDYYGSDFFTNYTASSVKGIILKNRVHIIFSTKAKVVCNYMGDNDYVMQEFSPFNASQYGFTLENLNLSAYHCRYCIHDERGTSTDAYCNTYINCNMYLDNRNSSWLPNQCIGGGLGVNGTIRVLNSIFESEDTGVTSGIVSYHNSNGANAQSTIEFVNCYCKGIGTFRLSWYGSTTLITRAMVCGCSLGSAIINSAEAGSTNNNTEIIAWNNDIRS